MAKRTRQEKLDELGCMWTFFVASMIVLLFAMFMVLGARQDAIRVRLDAIEQQIGIQSEE